MRGNVGRTLAVEAVLGCVLRVVKVQTTHVELFSHDVGVDVMIRLWRVLLFVIARMSDRKLRCLRLGWLGGERQAKDGTRSDETRKSRQKRA